MNLQQRNLDRILSNKANYDTSVAALRPPAAEAYYRGVNSSGRHIVQTLNGNIYYGDALSNGATAIGDKVGLNLTLGGTPQIDMMPR